MRHLKLSLLAAGIGILLSVPACTPSVSDSGDTWLKGTAEEKFDRIAEQLGGFDATMMSVSHKYQELYWAGQDKNWDYAAYQIEEMREEIERGIERRPERAESAQMIFPALDQMEEAITARDAALFDQRFTGLTATCNTCHRQEDMAFIAVAPPQQRLSIVQPLSDE
ncbi:MAG: hypothetical protein KFH87_05035 [Bacteroidetes bacterium]|nr:hypothetical protein [Bacteroidota bacterium]